VLCLLGPILVIYHSTFKAAGIAGISMWSMLSVASSGIIGRFLYVLIPRNSVGGELSRDEINAEFDKISESLTKTEEGKHILSEMDKRFASLRRPRNIRETIARFLEIQRLKASTGHWISQLLKTKSLPRNVAHQLRAAALARAKLLQRSVLLIQVEQLFYYWHAIHMPFTIIMFITLAVHIGVAIWLGYTWIY
jgi:hypothetical protein